jgi:sulfotransferase famil protein
VNRVSDWLREERRRMFGTRAATFPSRYASVRARVGGDRSRPLHFLHLGKTGGTAFKHALLDNREVSGYRLLLHGHDVKLADVPAGERFMFVVRDPFTRFVSGFNGRLRADRPRYHYPWREEERVAFAIFKTPDQLATALSSADDAERKQAEEAMRGIGHINTSYWFWFGDEQAFRDRASDLFFIAFQEQLEDDFELLKRMLGLPPEAHLPTDATTAHRSPAGFDAHLSDVALTNLERWYERDFAFVRLCRELAAIANGTPR